MSEFNHVLARRIAPDEIFEGREGLRPVHETEMKKWSWVLSEAFSEYLPVSEEMAELIRATCQGAQCWFAGEDKKCGGAAMGIENSAALFFGDAILPAARGKGWQKALIRERLAAAQERGCDVAMVSVTPGSMSHRNYERCGFELMYTRANVQRTFDSA